MKKGIGLLLAVILIAGGVYYYLHYYRQKSIDPWLLVPSNAIMAYEHSNLIESWNRIVDKPVWKTLKKMPYFHAWEADLIEADSLSGKEGWLDRLFRNRRLIVSAHVTSSDLFDFLFILDLKDATGRAAFDKLRQSILKKHTLVAQSRTYKGFELMEIINKSTKETFTWFVYRDIVVGSFTPFLVEDVVRNITDKFTDNFQQHITALDGISKLENDEGNIYLDFRRLYRLIAVFLKEDHARSFQNISNFADNTFLDLKVTDHEILLNGVSTVSLNKHNSLLSAFEGQNPGKVKMTRYLPNNTALLYHVTFSDFKKWHDQLFRIWSATKNDLLQQALDFDEQYDLEFDWVGDEAANAILETPGKDQPEQLFFVSVSDKDKAMEEMNRFAMKLAEEKDDTVYIDIYNNIPIVQITYPELPSMLAGEQFKGYENAFMIMYEGYLVAGNSMRAIKFFIDENENEDTWGKCVRQSMFLENTLGEASFSLMINSSRCWPWIIDGLNDRWAEIFKNHENVIKSFDRIAFQVSNLDGRLYTSVAVSHHEQKAAPPKTIRIQRKQHVRFSSPLITRPFIVKNHVTKKFEVLVQDSALTLHLISNGGEVLWSKKLPEKIVSRVYQIDFYKNSKLQYLFATEHQLHLIDRKGRYVEDYPIVLKKGVTAEYLSVIDYDNSKRYRFMLADVSGDIYLYDKKGKNLEGWNPRPLDGSLALPGFHIRVKGGDCMIALQSNGVLNVMNRRGKMYPGFPVDLKTTVNESLFADIGNDFKSTRMVTVSEEGEIIEVNLKGKMLRREQLYKPDKESRFRLVNDALNKTFVIVRREYNKVSILDRKGNLMMEKNIIASGDLDVQFYNFSTENSIIVINDPVQEFSYVYDKSGESITFGPLESSHPVGLIYSQRKKEYMLYKCYKNDFSIEIFH